MSVPTAAERASGYTDLSDIISGQNGAPRADALGRQIPIGTILDPATTRAVTAGVLDPISHILSPTTGYVRDPFSTVCAPNTINYSLAACPDLNNLSNAALQGRFDANAVKLLNLFPAPTSGGLSSNFGSSPKLFEQRN